MQGPPPLCFFLDKCRGRDQKIAPQHPAAGVVDIAQRAGVDLGFHGLGYAGKAEMLRGHQRFSGFVAGSDHAFDILGCGGEGLFADDMLAGFQRGDGERSVVHIGDAEIDDVDVRV